MLERSGIVKENLSLEKSLKRVKIQHPELPKPRPSDWGVGVTICIAAICDQGRSLLLATDQKISTQSFSGDAVALKICAIHPKWAMMYASSELGCIGPIVGGVIDELKGNTQKVSARRVREVVLKKYAEAHKRKADSILAPLSFDLDSFMKEGRRKLGPTIFAQYCADLAQVSLNSDFLVAGFDEEMREASIFQVSKLGHFDSHDALGFWAVGSGAPNALAILFFHSFNILTERERAIYQICEAKFMAESAEGVGEHTVLIEMRASGDESGTIYKYEFSEEFVAEIRQLWEAGGRPRIPEGVETVIAEKIKDPKRRKLIQF